MSIKEILSFEKKIASQLIEPKDIAMAYVNFGNELANQKMDSTIPAFIALHIFQDINDSNGIVQACMIIANQLFLGNQYNHALHYLKMAERHFVEDDKSKMKAYLLNKIGFIYFNLKQYPESIEAYLICADILETMGDLSEIPKIYCTLGFIYQDLKKFEEANEMFQKASNIARLEGNEVDAQKYESLIL